MDKKGYIALPSCRECEGPGCKRCANDLSTALGSNLKKQREIEDKRRRKKDMPSLRSRLMNFSLARTLLLADLQKKEKTIEGHI